MGHMLRKTAVIAVLILMMSSFTLGSTGRILTVAAAGNEDYGQGQSAQERGQAFLPTLADIITMGHAKDNGGSHRRQPWPKEQGRGKRYSALRGLRRCHPPVQYAGH
jgi:hypothetical protein